MLINTNIIIAGSMFAGFKNYASASFSASYAGGSIGTGAFVGPIRASTPLNNNNAVSGIELKYTGLDTFWRLVVGSTVVEYPNAALPQYEVQSLAYFTGGILFVDTYIVNETGGSISLPAVTVECQAKLYVAPF